MRSGVRIPVSVARPTRAGEMHDRHALPVFGPGVGDPCYGYVHDDHADGFRGGEGRPGFAGGKGGGGEIVREELVVVQETDDAHPGACYAVGVWEGGGGLFCECRGGNGGGSGSGSGGVGAIVEAGCGGWGDGRHGRTGAREGGWFGGGGGEGHVFCGRDEDVRVGDHAAEGAGPEGLDQRVVVDAADAQVVREHDQDGFHHLPVYVLGAVGQERSPERFGGVVA